ncbi:MULTISPECIES: hypothetical protein [unclassified Mesorhizobium]|uniref:hypothetical protein n=1 Tax=unclassified Mesorhizobium TaxID=325217 RepID=UPI001CCD4B14|nr:MULTISPECIES: hypothetical protein [unclassified Mesorhizobium]MBZ9742413.1 hypothetical protein [Mesorhizobium sp. CO1-1-4]MBZ9802378.1 hypothetical protein [Mesorhizobium sp. ES1-6]
MPMGTKSPEAGKGACLAESECIRVTSVKGHGEEAADPARQRTGTAYAAAMIAVLAMTGHAELLNAGSGACTGDLSQRRFIPAAPKSAVHSRVIVRAFGVASPPAFNPARAHGRKILAGGLHGIGGTGSFAVDMARILAHSMAVADMIVAREYADDDGGSSRIELLKTEGY